MSVTRFSCMNEFWKDIMRQFTQDLSYTVIIITMIRNVPLKMYAFLSMKNLNSASMGRDVKGRCACTPMKRKMRVTMS